MTKKAKLITQKEKGPGEPQTDSNGTESNGVKAAKQSPGVAAPPDGGWGWIVVLSSFSISLLVDGTCFSFGIFFDEFRTQFNTNKSETSWIGSVLNGSYLIFGPIISALVNMYGCKSVAIAGAIVSFLAFFASTFSQEISVFIFSYGFIGGIGFGLMYLPAIVMVGYYFERRRALATGIACCGSGIGAFLFAPFTEYLLHEYGWRGATWIISALIFNGSFFAIFYRPLPKPTTKEPAEVAKNNPIYRDPSLKAKRSTGTPVLLQNGDNDTKDIRQMTKGEIFHSLTCAPALKPEQKTMSMTLFPPPANYDLNVKDQFKTPVARLAYSQDLTSYRRHKGMAQRSELQQPMSRKDIFYSGSLWHLKEFREAGSLEEFRQEMKSGTIEASKTASTFQKFLQAVANVFDMSVLQSPTFLIYGVSCFLCMAGFFVPFIYLPTHATDLGLDSTQGAFLISIIGITNTVGRVAVGFISDQSWADCLLINNVALILGGVATIFVPYYPEYYLLAIYSCIFGAAIAVFVSLRSIIMVELMGIEKLTTAFGFVIMCQGMSSFVGAPIAGAISDATGNYNASFYLAGITLTLSGLICLPLRRVANWEKNRRESSSKSYSKGKIPWDQEMEVIAGALPEEKQPMV
ncbi:monocarboxylate transporter 13 [Biomphalaria glabrata]|nr:monocarboxylate transporter 13 [Biomphalaria glabrata]